jgi:hypothetical protein
LARAAQLRLDVLFLDVCVVHIEYLVHIKNVDSARDNIDMDTDNSVSSSSVAPGGAAAADRLVARTVIKKMCSFINLLTGAANIASAKW